MGLVSTWLNGIGLSSAVPTFQAAGIVTPAALAELDVAHFEALGISDPDDRRKLFYLVQRIKMAVNKDKPKESVEDQVDAVISGTAVEDVDEEYDGSEKKEERLRSLPTRNRKDESQSVAINAAGEVRRSRRLASKQEVTSTGSGSSKENQSVQGSPSKARKNVIDRPVSPSKSTRGSRTSATVRGGQRIVSPKAKVRVRTEQHKDDDVDEEFPEDEQDPAPKMSGATRKSTSHAPSTTKANAVFNLEDDDDTTSREPAKISPTGSGRTSGLKKPTPVSTSFGASDGESTSSGNTSNSKSQKAPARRIESKLQNPGKSIRTGKRLSAIPSERIAPMSPLADLPPGGMQGIAEEAQPEKASRRNSGQHRRQESAGSQGSTNLDYLLQSDIEPDIDGESDQESLSRSTRSERKRPKSTGMSESAAPSSRAKSNSRRASTHLTSSKSDLTGSSNGRRKSEDITKHLVISHSDSSLKAPTSKPVPFVHGGTHSESWATQVEHLREDNNSEHELFRDQDDRQIYDYDMRIRVIVRKRPLNKTETSLSGGVDVIHPLDYGDFGKVLVYHPKTRVDLTKEVETIPFAYDNVFDESSTNIQIYQRSLRNLIQPFFRGQPITIFGYGQTGSGKTYTMMGSNMTGINAGTANNDKANLGLYYLAALDIFDMVKRPEYRHLSVQVSLFEIYSGKLFDLLNSRKQVKCLEDSRGKVCFPGLTEHPVGGPDDLMGLIEEGATNRSTGTTSRNADSSRSHAVLQLKLRKDVGRKKNIEHGRWNFIDLAGSERGADTSSASRATRLEGAEINTSLLALKEVIRALATGGSMTHIPFRGSKLTQVLKDSFVGENSRCCMIACVSPDIGNCEQTLNTLRYADRVKERDSESGALSNGYEQPTRLQPLQWVNDIKVERQSDQSQDSPQNSAGDVDDEDSGSLGDYQSDADTAALDDLLTTSLDDTPKIITHNAPGMASHKQRAGEALVSAHRSVMSKMLSMVKDEMTLVNKVDADRDGLDDYLVQLETIQKTQLDLISKLRGSLSRYVTACEYPAGESSAVSAESDDESFEDLRD